MERGKEEGTERGGEVTRISGLPLTSLVTLNELVGISEPQIFHHKEDNTPTTVDLAAGHRCED